MCVCVAEERIQRVYERLQARGGGVEEAADSSQFPGVLRLLMERGQLPLELIRANITELMAGGVDTVSDTNTHTHQIKVIHTFSVNIS